MREDKKFKQLRKKYAKKMRLEGRHIVKVDTGTQILIVAKPNVVRGVAWTPNVKGMRWQDGKLVPRKGGPK